MARPRSSTSRKTGSRATAARTAALASRGEWVYGTVTYQDAYDLTAGADAAFGVTAPADRCILPYWEWHGCIWNETDNAAMPCWVAVVKYTTADGVPQIDSATQMAKFKEEGRIFFRDIVMFTGVQCGYKTLRFKYRNVELLSTESFGVVICPIVTKADIEAWHVQNYRIVEV